ncbi:MAG: hypothetical protein ACTSWX_04735 [Promethearchaeota archaeon]
MNEQGKELRTKIKNEQILIKESEDPPVLKTEKNKTQISIGNGTDLSFFPQNNLNSIIIPLNYPNHSSPITLQYKIINDTLQYYFNKYEANRERNFKEFTLSDEIGKFSGKIHIKTTPNDEIQSFLQNFTAKNSCKIYKINFFGFNLELKNHIYSLSESLKQFFISKQFSEPFIFIFPLNELECLNSKDINLIHSIFKITECFNPISIGGIFLFISSLNQNLPLDSNNFFDIELKLQIPETKLKKHFIESILEEFPHDEIDVDYILLQLKNCNLGEIRKFLTYAYKYYKMNKNAELTKKIKFNTSLLNFLLENQIFYIRNTNNTNTNKNDLPIEKNELKKNELKFEIQKTIEINKNFEHQLYQEAASKNYEDICIILDKIQKGIVLLPFERNLLADNSFILKDDPNVALKKLNKAKITVDKFKKIIS